MEQNLFEELQAKKQHLVIIAKKATEYGWITLDRQKEIVEKLENDTLTIGVIGQMKCGKSTFLNSFVFEDNVLPAATTPMTAALSVITYGEDKKIVAEFYTTDEWEEQKLQASRSLDEVQGNTLEESKVKAAKELVEKSSKLGSSLMSLLGKTQEDQFENLIEYVGADGKYISITKSVTIYYPKEYLKGVEIVDTPGFNDPIVSREERTKAFLKKADVVLMMLYAGRPFDATDRDILFQNVRQCGIGKVIIGINKYDIPYENGETEEEIKNYVKEEIRKACRACDDDTLVEILKQAEPIPLSAEMALLSELPMGKITSNDAFQFAWKRACDNFEISSQSQMREKSHLNDLTSAVKQMIETEKGKILFAKPMNSILAAGNSKKDEIEKALRECDSLITNLSTPDDELDEKEEKLNKAERRLNKKIDSLGDDLDSAFQQIIRKGRNELEDAVDATCNKMTNIVDEWGMTTSIDTIIPKLVAEQQKLVTRTLKRAVENLDEEAKRKVKSCVNDFFADAEDILMRYVPEFDSRDFIKAIGKKIDTEIEDDGMFSFDNGSGEEEDASVMDILLAGAFGFLNGYTFGALGMAKRLFTHGEHKKNLLKHISDISNEFNPQDYLESIHKHKDEIIDAVKDSFIEELINPMQEQIREIRLSKKDREKQLSDAKANLVRLKTDKVEIEKQLNEVACIKV